ncbi:MAG: hypothetical protein KBS60_00465 [Phascolarctobacterium sp.]|nr:hypothetical protein [Candidatus Phascolarctobacterium caballi]
MEFTIEQILDDLTQFSDVGQEMYSTIDNELDLCKLGIFVMDIVRLNASIATLNFFSAQIEKMETENDQGIMYGVCKVMYDFLIKDIQTTSNSFMQNKNFLDYRLSEWQKQGIGLLERTLIGIRTIFGE